MQIRLAIFAGATQVLTETIFWDYQFGDLRNLDSILFEAPVVDGLVFLDKWLASRSMTLAEFCTSLPNQLMAGLSFAFNMPFADAPALLLVYVPRAAYLIAIPQQLDRSFLPALDAIVSELPTYFIINDPNPLLLAYLRLTSRLLDPFGPDGLPLDPFAISWHTDRWKHLVANRWQ